MLRPLLLSADNFTPPARTPWGGRKIMERWKAQLGLRSELAGQAVGESWELSLGPELPSQLDDGRTLAEVIAQDLLGYLGAEAGAGSSALLVKWLDAAENLSVQIHPRGDDPQLAADETGKPESWYIVDAEPGAGIHLGLLPGVREPRMRELLQSAGDVSQLLEFVSVAPGDFFLLPPGLPHAVGHGVTLIEPQFVVPGKKGVTLRYWDWNRRYDASGKADPQGSPRALHVERALGVTDWLHASDPSWLKQQRAALGPALLLKAARCDVLCGPETDCAVRSDCLRVARIAGAGQLDLPSWDTLTALTVLSGSVLLHGDFGELRVPAGRTAALPARLSGRAAVLDAAHALISACVPVA